MTTRIYGAVFATLVVVAAIVMVSFIRSEEVVVTLPIASALARVQAADGGYVIVVETPHGRIRHKLWEDWGPADRTSLYVTPEGWVVALGGGGEDTMIAITGASAPALVAARERGRTNPDAWLYIGAVDVQDRRLRFFAPSEQAECFAMFGAGASPYRKDHQAEHFCP
jgi:hypothetical protein